MLIRSLLYWISQHFRLLNPAFYYLLRRGRVILCINNTPANCCFVQMTKLFDSHFISLKQELKIWIENVGPDKVAISLSFESIFESINKVQWLWVIYPRLTSTSALFFGFMVWGEYFKWFLWVNPTKWLSFSRDDLIDKGINMSKSRTEVNAVHLWYVITSPLHQTCMKGCWKLLSLIPDLSK